jgi:hypothetical protein
VMFVSTGVSVEEIAQADRILFEREGVDDV